MVLVKVVINLPISFLPWAQRVHAANHSPSHTAQWLSSVASHAATIYRSVFGGPASADCLLQSRGLWEQCNAQAAGTGVMMRALIRSVQQGADNLATCAQLFTAILHN
jgi:hypothetical protein